MAYITFNCVHLMLSCLIELFHICKTYTSWEGVLSDKITVAT